MAIEVAAVVQVAIVEPPLTVDGIAVIKSLSSVDRGIVHTVDKAIGSGSESSGPKSCPRSAGQAAAIADGHLIGSLRQSDDFDVHSTPRSLF